MDKIHESVSWAAYSFIKCDINYLPGVKEKHHISFWAKPNSLLHTCSYEKILFYFRETENNLWFSLNAPERTRRK